MTITVCISDRLQKTCTNCINQPQSPVKTERDFLDKVSCLRQEFTSIPKQGSDDVIAAKEWVRDNRASL